MGNLTPDQLRKRKLVALMTLFPLVQGCSKSARVHTAADPQQRFRGIGLVLVVDAVAGTEMEQVVIYDDRECEIYSSAIVAKRNRSIIAVGSGRVPLTVHVVWRKGAGWDNVKKLWNDGVIEGDYRDPVAKRIPDDILHNIREHGGNLRLKFRLKPNGILFGWDIERADPLGDVSNFEMPGGDFLETRY